MGAAKVGKTSLISQFLYNTFSEKYKRTIEEMHHAEFSVTGVHLTLDILDTSGSYEFPAMRALSISSADAFILVYSVVDGSTFEDVRQIRDQIIETKGTTEVPIVVVGNKFDLANDQRQVSPGDTKEWSPFDISEHLIKFICLLIYTHYVIASLVNDSYFRREKNPIINFFFIRKYNLISFPTISVKVEISYKRIFEWTWQTFKIRRIYISKSTPVIKSWPYFYLRCLRLGSLDRICSSLIYSSM